MFPPSDHWEIRYKTPLSFDHFEAAITFAHQARAIEDGGPGSGPFHVHMEHRGAVVASIVLSVGFMEALINELFSDLGEDRGPLVVQAQGLSPDAGKRLARLWGIERIAWLPVLDKYEFALAAADRKGFDRGADPYQPVGSVVDLRNALTHFKPEWQVAGTGPDDVDDLGRLARRLRGRFPLNPLAAEGQPFYPDKCLGFGAARWAVRSSFAFVKGFHDRMGMAFNPEYIVDGLNALDDEVT